VGKNTDNFFSHAISHGFDVVIFESKDKVGGIWANVNSTSGLQLNSLLYRFHPALLWKKSFPQRDEILGGMPACRAQPG
jgi:cation diffusion facilitator CzcD-associated flavoprotein CzcO